MAQKEAEKRRRSKIIYTRELTEDEIEMQELDALYNQITALFFGKTKGRRRERVDRWAMLNSLVEDMGGRDLTPDGSQEIIEYINKTMFSPKYKTTVPNSGNGDLETKG